LLVSFNKEQYEFLSDFEFKGQRLGTRVIETLKKDNFGIGKKIHRDILNAVVSTIEKELTEFYKKHESKDGYRSNCKKCQKPSLWSKKNPENSDLAFHLILL
jgi:hypothetical protein